MDKHSMHCFTSRGLPGSCNQQMPNSLAQAMPNSQTVSTSSAASPVPSTSQVSHPYPMPSVCDATTRHPPYPSIESASERLSI